MYVRLNVLEGALASFESLANAPPGIEIKIGWTPGSVMGSKER